MSKELELIAEVKRDLNRSIFKLNTVQDSISRAAIALLIFFFLAFSLLVSDGRSRTPQKVEDVKTTTQIQSDAPKRMWM